MLHESPPGTAGSASLAAKDTESAPRSTLYPNRSEPTSLGISFPTCGQGQKDTTLLFSHGYYQDGTG